MRKRIVGTENRYYRTEQDADSGCTPVLTHQINAIANPDNKTWMVSETVALVAMEHSKIITRSASLTEAFNLVRADEEHPKRHRNLPVLRQLTQPEDRHEYWRNMPRPL